jgi:hypothetical protein
MLETLATTAAEASFRIPIAWALTGFLTLCGAVAGMGMMDILTFTADGTNWYGSIIQGFTP